MENVAATQPSKKKQVKSTLKRVNENKDIVTGFFTVVVDDEFIVSVNIDNEYAHETGYVCVMVQRPPKGSDSNQYRASFSFCSPADAAALFYDKTDLPATQVLNKHFRNLSKRIAACRLFTDRVKAHVEFTLNKTPETKIADLFAAALDAAKKTDHPGRSNKKMVPDWVLTAKSIEYGLTA